MTHNDVEAMSEWRLTDLLEGITNDPDGTVNMITELAYRCLQAESDIDEMASEFYVGKNPCEYCRNNGPVSNNPDGCIDCITNDCMGFEWRGLHEFVTMEEALREDRDG